MRILLTGLPSDADVARLSERMARFGPVLGIERVDEAGAADSASFLVDLALDTAQATEVARRIDGIWFAGRFLRARVILHG